MIYIQVNEDGFPWHDTCLHVYEECIEGEVDYGLVDERTFGRTRFRPEDVFVGDIPYTSRFIREVLRRDFEMLECYPAELRPFLGRDIFPLSLDELRMRTKPLFVKPMEPKLFAGGVQTFEEVEPHLPPGYDTSLATCFGAEPVDIRAEYRFFVSRGEIVGIQHADGDFRRFPEVGEIKEWIASFRAQPVAFCLDVGLLEDRQVVVETNDILCASTFGFDEGVLRMQIDRFDEIRCSEPLLVAGPRSDKVSALSGPEVI